MAKGTMTLRQALDKMLELANAKLEYAKLKGKEWDINHYENDIKIINEQLVSL